MDPTPALALEAGLTRLWADRATARRMLFEARDSMTAAFLQRAGAGRSAGDDSKQISSGAPDFVLALPKPVRPNSWLSRRAFKAALRKRRRNLQESGLFDSAWYVARYPDVALAGMDGLTHFLDHGSFEGRSPGPKLDAIGYLARYPDIAAEGIEPWLHYIRHGKAEGRSPI